MKEKEVRLCGQEVREGRDEGEKVGVCGRENHNTPFNAI